MSGVVLYFEGAVIMKCVKHQETAVTIVLKCDCRGSIGRDGSA